ncbi:dihydroneopterin aldolase [Acidithiobacillus acidisediminis]|jgi:dihydroneopterin aldolase|uniref:dihydroneopterin aldolase n=1 Tax=Acidithiobacillus TaxID=119977 RepID=UPI00200D7D82|nr:dihydroneopterin aldolase [Acidithiobacillus sp. S30A2]
MDILFVRELKVQTRIGIYDWEREVPQTVLIDLEIAADAAHAAQSDRVAATINYQTVCDRIVETLEAAETQLVETVAENIAELVRGEFAAAWVQVSVHKPAAVRGTRDVGVRIERGLSSARGVARN